MSSRKVYPENGVLPGASKSTEDFADAASSVLHSPSEVIGIARKSLMQWLKSHIFKRSCSHFIPVTSKRYELCKCGHEREQHNTTHCNFSANDDEVWDPNSCTYRSPTDTFGEIAFVGYGQRIGKYVRVEHETNMDTMITLLKDVWKLKTPNLLISVTGGAKNFSMNPRLKQVFRRSLVKAAESNGAWIITSGTHTGVMKHVGEALQDYILSHGMHLQDKVIALGIAPWGVISNRDGLTHPMGKWPAFYRVDTEPERMEVQLDPNHSHFILVDDGTQHKYGNEIGFREKLVKAVSLQGMQESGSLHIPVVCIVLEGGPGTLENVYTAMMNNAPTVVIEGSGRAADLLAYAYQTCHTVQRDVFDEFGQKSTITEAVIDEDLRYKLMAKLSTEFGATRLLERWNWLEEILKRRNLLYVFKLDSGNLVQDIDVAMLRALLNASESSLVQLKLTLAWNRIDMAREYIFVDDIRWKTEEVTDVIMNALLNNRVEFMKALLEQGISLCNFLTYRRLEKLYNKIPLNSHLRMLLHLKGIVSTDKPIRLEKIGNLIGDLMGDFFKPPYVSWKKRKAYMSEKFKRNIRCGRSSSIVELRRRGTEYFEDAARELFYWAVLVNHYDMAVLFWLEGKNQIAAALSALKLISEMTCHIPDFQNVMDIKMEDSMRKFEDLALGTLKQCYEASEQKTLQLLVQVIPEFGETTCLSLAVAASSYDFISSAACQKVLNDIWRGGISLENGILKITLSLIFPPLIFAWIRFDQEVIATMLQDGFDPLEMLIVHAEAAEDKTSNGARTRPLSTQWSEPASKTTPSHQPPLHLMSSVEYTRHNPKTVNLFYKIVFFYNSPKVTFLANCISYFAFLLLFSYIILTSFTVEFTTLEYGLCGWVFTIFLEECRQVVDSEGRSFLAKVKNYLADFWNVEDLIVLAFFTTGIALKVASQFSGLALTFARAVLAADLVLFFMRLLHIFLVHKQLGPKLVMIYRMLFDLISFMVIMMVFVVAYGIASQAVLYPNTPFGSELFRGIFYNGYFQIYGELLLENVEGDGCTTNDTYAKLSERCPVNSSIVLVLLAVYLLLTNVLLINLLIAMFSYTFEKARDKTDSIWKFYRYWLVKEYFDRPPLAPPLIILAHLFLMLRALFRKKFTVHSTSFRQLLGSEEKKNVERFEVIKADDYFRIVQSKINETDSERMKQLQKSVEMLLKKVDQAEEVHRQSVQEKQPEIQSKIIKLENQLNIMNAALKWIMNVMIETSPDITNLPPAVLSSIQQTDKVKKVTCKVGEVHVKCRASPYIGSMVWRFDVPDEKVPWEVPFPEYSPLPYTADSVLNNPPWADHIDLFSLVPSERLLPFNAYDHKQCVDRRSYSGQYRVVDGLPLNPMGRTGLTGRGNLGRWGPNHGIDSIVSRWKRLEFGKIKQNNGKPVLEFVAVKRDDSDSWALTGGLLEGGEKPDSDAACRDFFEKALGSNPEFASQQDLKKVFTNGELIYEGCVDDPRNTDNAWVETKAINYHEKEETSNFLFKAGKETGVDAVTWLELNSAEIMHSSHSTILRQLAVYHDASY